MTVRYFEELEIWKDARRLTRDIYRLTRNSKFRKDFSLREQMRRAAVSIMSNIAEGFERGGNQEFMQFLYIAKGSCGELRSQIYVALDQGYLEQLKAEDLIESLKRSSIMISNLINYIRRSGMRGEKFNSSNRSRNPAAEKRTED
jgi:four helix bundle protein